MISKEEREQHYQYLELLSGYNQRRFLGIVHTEEYEKKMAEISEKYEAQRKAWGWA